MSTYSVEVRKRITFIFFALFFIFFLLVLRLGYLQIVKGTWYQQKALENRIREIVVEPKRGDIYDRNGNELAVSINADACYAVPAEVKKSEDVEDVAQELAEILDMDQEKVYKLITQEQHSVWLKFKLTEEEVKKLREKNLPGIGTIPKPQRFYPKGNLASHVLGFAGDYNQGLEGIEVAYEEELAGINGYLLVEYDAAGHEIPESTKKYIEPEQGLSVVLTIDQTIQHIAERELDKIMQKHSPKSATIIVMDPKTGEILAMANKPDFNPNEFHKYAADVRRNGAVSDSYEPGSTFKIVTLAAALEEGLTNQQDRFHDPGFIEVNGERIRCWVDGGHGNQSLSEIVQNSCNPGFITLGMRLGTERFYKYIRGFGFGSTLGFDLPGEATGIIVPEDQVKPVDLATISMGQTNSVTPLQMVTALSAVVNGGKLMKPHIVKELRNKDGDVVKTYQSQVIRQIISEETSKIERELLENVVSHGSGRNAYIEGYSVGGKTGTAQKPAPGGGYSSSDYIASFLGFAPVDDPRLVCLVVVDSPKGYPYYGGTVAAPAFREVVGDSLRYLGVPVRYSEEDNKSADEEMTTVPMVINLPVDEAEKILKDAGLQVERSGSGDIVYGQVPVDGIRVKIGSKVLLQLQKMEEVQDGERIVPNIKGKSMRDAAELLGMMGLVLVPEGDPYPTGIAVEQSPAPGTKVPAGEQVRVKFKPPSAVEVAP
ncbi:MAG: stage V sporulation protein D [Thermoanaerobacterales bacterium]|jgi:stage V sporulation protein D (sporulation-specific penicillin-binding protein)|nr:stage V sporulation protein D [Thermoanaerobacterales bacterium]